MKLKEYLERLNKLIKENPSCLDMEMLTSIDDEDNGYVKVSYPPSIGKHDTNLDAICVDDEEDDDDDDWDCDCDDNCDCDGIDYVLLN